MNTLMVSEVFGPTVQGEGPSTGRRCSFVRFGRCNLTCSWCDTPYTWDWKGQNGTVYNPATELARKTITEIVDELATHQTDMVVITGGEPLVQLTALIALAQACQAQHWRVEIETNGTIMPDTSTQFVDRFNISPKLANSGVKANTRIVIPTLQHFGNELPADQVAFKFVARNTNDLDEIDNIVRDAELNPRQIWVMPEGTNAATILDRSAELAQDVIDRNYNLTTRLHVLLWGNTRGV